LNTFPEAGTLTKEQALYLKMLRIRKIEEAIAEEYKHQEMRCPVHLSIGQESPAVAVCHHLDENDLMVSTHRGHAHYLAKGGSLKGLLCELYGKSAGCSRGQGGSMHLVDHSVGFSGSTSIVGGTIPVGVGLAFAKKQRKEAGIVVVCFGDAAIEQGVFHESANFASLHGLPVLFFCENNLYSCYTHIHSRQPIRPMSAVASAHGLEPAIVYGSEPLSTTERLEEIIHSIHLGEGPWFVECTTYRHREHCGPNSDDHLNYRNPEERLKYMSNDPIDLLATSLKASDGWDVKLLNHMDAIDHEIRTAFDFAKKAPFPTQEELGAYEYAHN
jgi:TPP-dependent pyruvate/acetoin dehydrogenase alpha subunit